MRLWRFKRKRTHIPNPIQHLSFDQAEEVLRVKQKYPHKDILKIAEELGYLEDLENQGIISNIGS